MPLDLTPLENALGQLETALTFAVSDQARQDAALFQQFRNSVIQCFEFTYELAWKMLKRQIESDSPSPEAVDAMSFRELIREGAERGLVGEPLRWFTYREQRNRSSHVYREDTAQTVYDAAQEFLPDARALLSALRARNPS